MRGIAVSTIGMISATGIASQQAYATSRTMTTLLNMARLRTTRRTAFCSELVT